jgi:hypothetical protein
MRLLLDSDSLIYIIAYNHREYDILAEGSVKESCDTFLRDILLLTGCDDYIAAFSSKECFRNELYKYAPYKGGRPEKPEWMLLWEPVIRKHYVGKHGFVEPEFMEADDICVAMAHYCSEDGIGWVIASPDKDLRQIAGRFYDYRQQANPDIAASPMGVTSLSAEQAHRNFWMSVLTGDSTDNIKAVPGLGPVKAGKLLDEAMDPLQYSSLALSAYTKYFGSHYGNIIFRETVDTIMMLNPRHTYWAGYKDTMASIYKGSVRILQTSKGIFDA